MEKKNGSIKIGYFVSYDWKLLENAIPCVYNEADTIVLALDQNRRTWAGNPFNFDKEAFDEFIGRIDIEKKIIVYEDNFYEPGLTTMQNEVRERNMLAAQLGAGGWHLQFDADEYPVNFSSFVAHLRKIDPHPDPVKIKKPVNVYGSLITIIKKVPGGYVYVKPDRQNPEWFPLATQVPKYENGRRNGYFNIRTPLVVVHESWSRSEEEFYFKLKNWGHNQDFDVDSYYRLWKAIDAYNYRFIKDFNPIGKDAWSELAFIQAGNVSEMTSVLASDPSLRPTAASLILQNSRNIARLKGLFARFVKN